jgi:hypothetical protein
MRCALWSQMQKLGSDQIPCQLRVTHAENVGVVEVVAPIVVADVCDSEPR